MEVTGQRGIRGAAMLIGSYRSFPCVAPVRLVSRGPVPAADVVLLVAEAGGEVIGYTYAGVAGVDYTAIWRVCSKGTPEPVSSEETPAVNSREHSRSFLDVDFDETAQDDLPLAVAEPGSSSRISVK